MIQAQGVKRGKESHTFRVLKKFLCYITEQRRERKPLAGTSAKIKRLRNEMYAVTIKG